MSPPLCRRREKVFGLARGTPLDREAKHRITVYAEAWNARHRQLRQHHGPITPAFGRVLTALLWNFHNSKTGLCFPSYEAVAAKAKCCRATVAEAIKTLEEAGILGWVNRIARELTGERDLFGRPAWRVIRKSNAYVFRDPLPCAEPKSENRIGTPTQGFLPLEKAATVPLETLGIGVLTALQRLGQAIAAKEGLLGR